MKCRGFQSHLRKVCQDATSYCASHLTAAETLRFVIWDDTWCSNTDTISRAISHQGKITKNTRRKAFVKLYFHGILSLSYTCTMWHWDCARFNYAAVSIYRGFYLNFYLNSEFSISVPVVFHHICHSELWGLYILSVRWWTVFRSYFFIVHFFSRSCSKNGWFPPITKLRGFLEIATADLHILQELIVF